MRRQLPLRKKLLASLIRTAVITTALAPAMSWAQSSDANLRGHAPASATVTAKNVATGLTRRTTAAEDGSYSLVGLPPGTYTVDAGAGSERTVTLSVASTADLDFVATAPATTGSATTLEGVSVTATTLTEVKTSEVGMNVSLHQIDTVPQATRNFLEFADTVPGMIFSTDSTGHTKLQGGAQNTSSVNVYIDGVGQKSYVKEGGVSGQFSSQGNPFPQLAIAEYKVITSNYKAEYDQVSSAAVTAVTKSGTNEFHGELFGDYTDDSLQSETPAELAAKKKTPFENKEYGFDVGGPIIQDQAHFFFTYERKNLNNPVTVLPGVLDAVSLLPTEAQSLFGPANNPFTEKLYFGKVDWEFTDRDRLELSGQYRDESTVDNVGNQTTASAGLNVKNTDKRYDLRWEHSADHWTNEALLTYENAANVPQAITTGIGQAYTFGGSGLNDALVVQTGAPDPRAQQNKGQKGPGFKDDLTFNNFNWYGDHTIKMGVKYKDVKLFAQDAGNATGQAFYNVCPLDSIDPACPPGTGANPYKAVFAITNPGTSPFVQSKDKQYGTYIQDDWAVNDKLTLNLGVRWDMESNPSYLNWVTPADFVAAINSQDPNAPAGQTYAQSLAKGGVNINDYISTGNNRKSYKGEWQPRLGFSYDLGGDEQHVIFGGAGRSYDRDLYDYLQLEQTKFALAEPTLYFSSPGQPCKGNPCVPFNPSYLNSVSALQALVAGSTAGYELDAFTNNLKAPYSDQFSLGMRNKVGDWDTSAAFSRILSYDGIDGHLGNRNPDGSFWMNGGQPWGDPIPNHGALILFDNGIKTKTSQILLSADKPYTKDSGWSASFAYTYTRAFQNRDINEHYAFDQETIDDYPFIRSNAAPKHRLVSTGSFDGGWGITYAAKITLATPTPNNGFISYPFPGPQAANGANNLPVAGIPDGGKRFLFGGPIFGYRSVDLDATKTFDLTHGMSLQFRIDALNVFNFKNLVDVSSAYPGYFPVSYIPTGNITGFPRTLKFEGTFRF